MAESLGYRASEGPLLESVLPRPLREIATRSMSCLSYPADTVISDFLCKRLLGYVILVYFECFWDVHRLNK